MYIYEKFRNIHIRINDLWSSDVCTFLLAFRDIGMLAMFPMWYMYVTSTWSAALAYQLEHGCARSWRWESDGNGGRMMLVLKTDGDGGWCSMQRQWRRRRLHTCLTLPIGPADEWSPEAHPSPFRSDPIRTRFATDSDFYSAPAAAAAAAVAVDTLTLCSLCSAFKLESASCSLPLHPLWKSTSDASESQPIT